MNPYLKSILFLSGFIFFSSNCRPADPNYKLKIYNNTDYSGFLTRNFFQLPIKIPVPLKEVSILALREECKIRSKILLNFELNQFLLKELKSVYSKKSLDTFGNPQSSTTNTNSTNSNSITNSSSNNLNTSNSNVSDNFNINNNTNKIENKPDDPKKMKIIFLTREDENLYVERELKTSFGWFLDSIFLFKEDYSNPDECNYVFRSEQKNLYKKIIKQSFSKEILELNYLPEIQFSKKKSE